MLLVAHHYQCSPILPATEMLVRINHSKHVQQQEEMAARYVTTEHILYVWSQFT